MSDGLPAAAGDGDDELRHVALAVRSRRQLLAVLRSAGRPVPVAELAAAAGLHVTTARVHLRVLERSGLVVRTPFPAGSRGRPKYLFAPVTDTPGEGHRQLAELLAGALGSDGEHGRRAAVEAGRRWAELEVPDGQDLSWEEAVAGVGDLFGRLGFAPRRVDTGRSGYRLDLDRCPFRDVARAHPEVVCAVHLGLMQGALARWGLPEAAEASQLQPFVAPELCVAQVPGPAGAADRR